MKLAGHIIGASEKGFTLFVPFDKLYLLDKWSVEQCFVELWDGRTISPEERRKIYATLREISEWTGYTPEETKELFKWLYCEESGAVLFSLSDCSISTANGYLQFLIDFCVENGIPSAKNMVDRSPDISKYLYLCLMHKKCAICGEKAELHHVDAVGMGRSRKEIIHRGMEVLPLCRTHHTECHGMGKYSFYDKYHVYGVRVDDAVCTMYKLKQ